LFAPCLLLVTACATAAPTPPAATTLPNDIRWAGSSAEYRAIFIQTYRLATERVRELAAGRERGTWAVILDADETVLDNWEYQRRLAETGSRFATNTWNAWVREIAADSLPGAAGFIRTVRELGGRVAIVTNRDNVVCDETRRNFEKLGIRVDAVLCQAPGERGKGWPLRGGARRHHGHRSAAARRRCIPRRQHPGLPVADAAAAQCTTRRVRQLRPHLVRPAQSDVRLLGALNHARFSVMKCVQGA